MSVEGVVNLFKPIGASSAQYVYRLRPILNVRRVGHAGALDPFADGVLLACVGRATRCVERLMELPKEYDVELRLGVENASHDPELPFLPVAGARDPDPRDVDEALRRYVGWIEQTPPQFSALKIDGRPAYRLARRGDVQPLASRRVFIERIDLLGHTWPVMRLRVVCGRGTYIRALARDLGQRWGCGAVCTALRRTRVGPFGVDASVNLNSAAPEAVHAALIDVERLMTMLPAPSAPAAAEEGR
ncbi:MAG: tRNA pseudouridine(55) synthase TruB [Phycisphaerae bacterium]|nr:tRNA pseudouridine(55) synthase TruB [Phycisphaerae bacterium]NUQ46366.1 tRNA pseudouridine(55) synthase TruB [Phycisphaerae bacterium]